MTGRPATLIAPLAKDAATIGESSGICARSITLGADATALFPPTITTSEEMSCTPGQFT